MTAVLLFPNPGPPELVRALDLAGIEWVGVANTAEVTANRPDAGWLGAIVAADEPVGSALSICRALRSGPDREARILVVISGQHLDELEAHTNIFDDFCLAPIHPREFEARVLHLTSRGPLAPSDLPATSVIAHGALALNVDSYQAMIGGVPLDLTHMEYELLRFLAAQPGRVFSRETLLAEVWGYDYFGGARTVDVHVRRLRAKFGPEHAELIQTVRSVGYSFGDAAWPLPDLS